MVLRSEINWEKLTWGWPTWKVNKTADGHRLASLEHIGMSHELTWKHLLDEDHKYSELMPIPLIIDDHNIKLSTEYKDSYEWNDS